MRRTCQKAVTPGSSSLIRHREYSSVQLQVPLTRPRCGATVLLLTLILVALSAAQETPAMPMEIPTSAHYQFHGPIGDRILANLDNWLLRAPVGDRYVASGMARAGAVLGGEPCGHIIYTPHLTSSDALLTGIAVLDIVARSGKPLSALAARISKRPQVSLDLPAMDAADLVSDSSIQMETARAERALAPHGRVVVRPSGTEPLIRIMCECEDGRQARAVADKLASVIAGCSRERGCLHADIAA